MTENFLIFDKRGKLEDSANLVNSKEDKLKKSITRHIISKFLKVKEKQS